MTFPQKLVPHIVDCAYALACAHAEHDVRGSYYTIDAIARSGELNRAYTRRMLEILVSRGFARKRVSPGLIINGEDAGEVYALAQPYVRMRPQDFAANLRSEFEG